MPIKVQDLLELDSFKSFHLVAGASGLNQPVESTGIVDWEFTQGIEMKAIKFEENSLVISSLLFAREDQSLFKKAMEYLILSGVSAMAYKDILIKELPQDAIRLAEEKGFPVFVFDQVYFEDILVDVHDAILAADQLEARSEVFRLLMNEDLSKNEVRKLARKIIPHMRKNVFTAFVHSEEGFLDREMIRVAENSSRNKKDDVEVTFCSYEGGMMMIVSADHSHQKKMTEVVHHLLSTTILHKSKTTLGMSGIYPWEELGHAGRDAITACTAARLEGKDHLFYDEIGTYQFLISGKDFEPLLTFMKGYLAPILSKNNASSKELLDTAIVFVIGNGNFKSVSERMNIHENTLRYRLGKLHKLLSSDRTEFEFYQNLTIAIKLYLIQKI